MKDYIVWTIYHKALFKSFSKISFASKYFRLLYELNTMILIQFYVLITSLLIKAMSFKKYVMKQTLFWLFFLPISAILIQSKSFLRC